MISTKLKQQFDETGNEQIKRIAGASGKTLPDKFSGTITYAPDLPFVDLVELAGTIREKIIFCIKNANEKYKLSIDERIILDKVTHRR